VVSAASGATAKSKVSLASAATVDTMLAKDKLAQVWGQEGRECIG
jgi:hypothetical protein